MTAPTSKARQARSALRDVASIHGGARRVIASILVVGTLAGILEAGALVLFMNAALRITSGSETNLSIGPMSADAAPTTLLLGAGAAIIAAAGLHAVLARIVAHATVQVLRNSRHNILSAYLGARWRTQAEVPDGTIQDSVFHLAQTAAAVARSAMAALNGVVILFALLVAAVVVSPVVTLSLVLSLAPIALLLRPLAKFARHRAQRAVTEVTDLSQEVASTSAMALEIQAFGVTNQQLDRLDHMNDAAADAVRGAQFSLRLSAYWFKDLALLMLIVVVGVIHLVWDLTDSSASAAIIIVVRALGYTQQSYNAYTNVVELAPSISELLERTESLVDQVAPAGNVPLESVELLRFDRVGYQYPNGHDALVDVTLDIPKGRVIGLVGSSGAGKSTLAEIILRLRQPTSGTITTNGIPLAETRVDDWRRLVAYVPQEPRLWQRTVADNIAFMRSQFSRDDVVAAARLAHLDSEIVALPQGYDTVLGTQSRGLSGGQRQRLAIARALISDPSLIVLDEPTSALDRHSERLLQRTLDDLRGHVTMIIIAHRTSTLDVCDDLVLIEGGRVAAYGERRALMNSHPFFERLTDSELDARGAGAG